MQYKATGYTDDSAPSKSITEECFTRTKKAKELCLFALELEEKLSLLLDNYFDFELEMLRLAQINIIWKREDHEDAMTRRLGLDRRLVNLLTSCRLYLDQTAHGLSSHFGKESDQLLAIKAFKNKLYDTHWGYRLMEALRNHVQHAGLLVHVICSRASRSEQKGSVHTEMRVFPKALVETLEADKEFKKQILIELKKGGSELDLRGPTREYLHCFVTLHKRIRELIFQNISEARSYYSETVSKYSTIEGVNVQFPRLLELRGEDGTTSEEIPLVTEFLDYFDALQRRNSITSDLRTTFASNSQQ